MEFVNLPMTPFKLVMNKYRNSLYQTIVNSKQKNDIDNLDIYLRSKPIISSDNKQLDPATLAQDTWLTSDMEIDYYEIKTDQNKRPRAVVTVHLVQRDEQDSETFKNNYKHLLISDLLKSGIPDCQLTDDLRTIDVLFSGRHYQFQVDDLKILDLFRFPSDNHIGRSDLATAHALELAEHMIYLPAISDGKPVLYKAQYKAASLLLEKWFDIFYKYTDLLNSLTKFIHEYEFSDTNTVKVLWNNLYEVDINSGIEQSLRLYLE